MEHERLEGSLLGQGWLEHHIDGGFATRHECDQRREEQGPVLLTHAEKPDRDHRHQRGDEEDEACEPLPNQCFDQRKIRAVLLMSVASFIRKGRLRVNEPTPSSCP